MKKIPWDDELSVGDPTLDAEHKQFIVLLNRLIDLIDESPDVGRVHAILDELEHLAATHSRHEEAFSRRAGGGRGAHGDLREAIVEARSLLSSEDLGVSLINMTETVVKLLINQIIDYDLDLAPLLSEQEVKGGGLTDYLVLQFQKISFVRGLEMLMTISLLPMLIFAGMIMYQSWQGTASARGVTGLAEFSQGVGELAYQLQMERGLTAGFLTSDDPAYQSALRQQRQQSDRQLNLFRGMVAAHQLAADFSGIDMLAAKVVVQMEALDRYRGRLDSRRMSPQEIFDRFTGLIAELTELVNQIAIVSRHQGASELFQANAILIQFGEMSSRECGIGAAGFGRGQFTRLEYRQLVSSITEQRTLERQLRSFLSEDQWMKWEAHFDPDIVNAYQRFSDYAIEYGSGDGNASLDSFSWFKVATQRITLINGFQRVLINDLQDEMRRQRSRSTALFMVTVFGGGAMVLFIGFFTLQLGRSIRLPILSLTNGMRALTVGDKSVRIPFATRQDELGEMVAAYEAFRRKLIRTDMLAMGEDSGPLAANRYALALKRSTAEGEQYKRLASIDSLTGLINRREFVKRAKREVARLLRHPGPLSVMLLDVDHFKRVNDTYGHPAGDRVLKLVARSIGSGLREEDVLARIGGEEFVALLPSTDGAAATATAERVRTAIEDLPIEVGGAEIRVTISIGISEFAAGEVSIESMMVRADKALYRAKEGGRNQVCVTTAH